MSNRVFCIHFLLPLQLESKHPAICFGSTSEWIKKKTKPKISMDLLTVVFHLGHHTEISYMSIAGWSRATLKLVILLVGSLH